MLDKIRDLAADIQLAKQADRKFVLMLGAGASLSSGVKLTTQIMRELVETHARAYANMELEDRFDKLWRDASAERREQMLAPHLRAKPGKGYGRLAELIREQFFDLVVTFNFDRMLELALSDVGFTDYKLLVRGDMDPAVMAAHIERREPRVKLLKMHGSVHADLLFSRDEMLNYPAELHRLLEEITGRPIIICGYGFADEAVKRCFNLMPESGEVYCVNPAGAPTALKVILARRRSSDRVIGGDLGKFDEFMETLHAELTRKPRSSTVGPKQNVFKFLDHYQEDNRRWFFGRRKLTFELARKLRDPSVVCLQLIGDAKVGKTSLVRAGLMPALAARGIDVLYHRCRAETPERLLAELACFGGTDGTSWSATLQGVMELVAQRAAEGKAQRLVLVLDQFEKPCRVLQDACYTSGSPLRLLLDELRKVLGARLCVLFVSRNYTEYLHYMIAARMAEGNQPTIVEPLSGRMVSSIIKRSARLGGAELKDQLVVKLVQEYEGSLPKSGRKASSFTLMHVQTVCYYLMKGSYPGWEGYQQLSPGLQAALDLLREDASLVDLLEDLPRDERSLFRSVLKIACDPIGANKLVELIRDRFADIKNDSFPEPVL